MNNTLLQDLIDFCEELGATVMSFSIIGQDDNPSGVIEDADGRLSSVWYEGGKWH